MLSSIPASFLLLYCKLLYLSHLVEELQSSIQNCFWVITASQHLIVHGGRKSSWGVGTKVDTQKRSQSRQCNMCLATYCGPRGPQTDSFPQNVSSCFGMCMCDMTKFIKSERHLESIYFHSERSTRGASSRKRFNLHVRTCMTRINVDQTDSRLPQ